MRQNVLPMLHIISRIVVVFVVILLGVLVATKEYTLVSFLIPVCILALLGALAIEIARGLNDGR